MDNWGGVPFNKLEIRKMDCETNYLQIRKWDFKQLKGLRFIATSQNIKLSEENKEELNQ